MVLTSVNHGDLTFCSCSCRGGHLSWVSQSENGSVGREVYKGYLMTGERWRVACVEKRS